MATFRTLELAKEFHKLVNNLSLTCHLRDQLYRAATSIPLNLAEGNSRPTAKDKKRFYRTAYASLKECQTILELASIDDEVITKKADHLGASLYKLTKATNPPLQ